MPPLQPNWPVFQAEATHLAPDSGTHASPPSSKGSSSLASSKQGSNSQVNITLEPAVLPDTQQDFMQADLVIPSDQDGSPPPHYTATYVDKATQTSPPPPSHSPFPNVSHHPYPYPYTYPVAYTFNQRLYPQPMPWPPAPHPSLFPPLLAQASYPRELSRNLNQERGYQGSEPARFPGPSAAPYPIYSYYQQQPPPSTSSHQYRDPRRPLRNTSPLIAPLPLLPLPTPESLPLVSEPPSPTISSTTTLVPASLSTLTSPPTSLIHRRSMSIPLSHRPASPIENPFHSLYKSLRSLLLISESDPSFLAREINGEQLVSVHGVGIWSYRGDTPPSLETAKQSAFHAHASYDAWLRAARARTAHYATPGAVRPPLRWVLIEGGGSKSERQGEHKTGGRRQKRKKDRIILPDDALQTGTEANDDKLYSARAWWEGGLHLGKAGAHLQGGGASISYGSLEHSLSTFEILVGDQQYAKWVDVPRGTVLDFPPAGEDPGPSSSSLVQASTHGPGDSAAVLQSEARSNFDYHDPHDSSMLRPALPVSFTPIEGGREANGEPLFVAQAEYERGWHPGKAGLGDDHCCIAYGGGELWVKGFRVLGYIV